VEITENLSPASAPAHRERSTFEPDPNNPHWGVWAGLGVWVLSVAAILFFPAVFLLPYIASSGIDLSGGGLAQFAIKDRTAIILQVAAIIPAHLFTLGVAWFVVTRLRRYPFLRSLGWDLAGVRWWHYLLMIAIILIAVVAASNIFPFKEDDLERIIRSSRTALYLVAFMAVFTAPLVEEVVYRGVLFAPIYQRFGTVVSVIAVTALFAAVHVPQYAENPGKIVLLTGLSLLLTLLRAGTGSLLPCVILHTLFNGLTSLLLIAEPAIKSYLPDPVPGFLTLFQ
jgi:uncharacterized protein